jgi:type I restriction enzyme S subunit
VKFKRETEFQETEIGKIPREWRVKKLGELVFEMYYGLTAKAVNQPTGLRMLRTTDIKDNYRVDWDSLPYCEITDNRRSNIQKYLLRKNDLVVSRAGTTGMSIFVDKDFNDVIFGSYLIKIKLNESVAYPKFIHYFMQSSLYWNQLLPKQAGSTLKNISLPILKNILTPLPPINEQKLIPEILSTVDRAIEVVDAGVARLEGLKKALMRELLTGRIRVREENGKPVFYRETEFQETEIGKIPREWKIERLKNVAMEIKSGFASGKRDETDGIIHLRMFNIGLNGMLSFDEIIKVPKPRDWRQYLLRHGDILLVNTSGSEEHIGKVAIFENVELECTYSNHLTRIRIDENEVDSRWVYFVLYYLWQTGYFKSLVHQQAGGQRNIPLKAIENLPITLPATNEARKIAEFLSMINTVIKLYREEMIRLERLKRGLMDLLLTGKIRVGED